MSSEDSIRLLVLRGVDGKREFLLRDEVARVGRPEPGWSPELPIVADGVVRHHATLRRIGEDYRLDPEPGAGVLVNRARFEGGVLKDGDQIAFGSALFQYWTGGLRRGAPVGEMRSAPEAPAARGSARPATRRLLVGLFVVVTLLLALVVIRLVLNGQRP